jgi:Tat protein secretion system quality control protein TatD with DNase activity
VFDLIDVHFHLDRLEEMVFMENQRSGSAELLGKLSPLLAKAYDNKRPQEYDLIGAVSAFVDPSFQSRLAQHLKGSWFMKNAQNRDPRLRFTVGLAPAHYFEASKDLSRHMQRIDHLLTKLPGVVALGEFGLDYKQELSTPRMQREVLIKLLNNFKGHLRQGLGLILTLRDVPGSTKLGVTEATKDAIQILEQMVQEGSIGRDQHVMLSNFAAQPAVVTMWLQHFPNTYFSLCGLVDRFSGLQRKAVSLIPPERLLIESNAPHPPLRTRPVGYSACYDVAGIAAVVAEIKQVPTPVVLNAVKLNAIRFYKMG